jgi:hypothetical protein
MDRVPGAPCIGRPCGAMGATARGGGAVYTGRGPVCGVIILLCWTIGWPGTGLLEGGATGAACWLASAGGVPGGFCAAAGGGVTTTAGGCAGGVTTTAGGAAGFSTRGGGATTAGVVGLTTGGVTTALLSAAGAAGFVTTTAGFSADGGAATGGAAFTGAASRKSARSFPAAKSWPSPRIAMTRMLSSFEAAPIASARAAYMSTVSALRRSGLASVIARTAPSLSTRTCSLIRPHSRI